MLLGLARPRHERIVPKIGCTELQQILKKGGVTVSTGIIVGVAASRGARTS